jgi:arylsulfatase A-like enzyme
MKITALERFASAVTLLALMGSATAFAQQSNKPNVVFILADNIGYGDLDHMAAASCVGLQRRASMHWLKRDCVSPNSWWNQLVPPPARRL